MSLSVVVVTRQQDEYLPRALSSLAGLGAELVVVDTARAEGTRRIAEAAGAVYVAHEWHDDFGAARNEGLERASREWVLLLHPDEEVLPLERAELDRALARDDVFAWAVRLQELRRPEQAAPLVETTPLRVFRRGSGVRFVGRASPGFEADPAELAAFQGRKLELAPVTLRHHAYLAAATPGKLKWTARILEKEIADRPESLTPRIDLGRVLLQLGDPRGHEVLAEAAERVWAVRGQEKPPAGFVNRLFEYLLTVSPHQARFRPPLTEVAALAWKWYPRSPVLGWRIAELAHQAGDHRRAAEMLEYLLRLGESGTYDRSDPFDPALLGDLSRVNLGMCLMQLGRLEEAARVLGAVDPGSPQRGQAEEYLRRIQEARAAAAARG